MATAQQTFQRMLGVVRILYGALVLSTFLLAVVTFVVQPNASQPPPQVLEGVFGVIAIVLAVLSFVLPRTLAPKGVRVAEVLPSEGGPAMPARFANPERAARQAMARAQTPFILSMALSEAVSCLGLALHMIGAPMMVSIPFLVAGTTLAAIRFPTVPSMVREFERAHGASFAASMDGGTL